MEFTQNGDLRSSQQITLRSFLIDGNIKLRNQLPKSRFTRYETLLKQLYNFYIIFYDTRDDLYSSINITLLQCM